MSINPESIPKEYLTGFTTRAIHVGNEPDPQTHAVTVPIYPVSTFQVVSENQKYVYSRGDNPTRVALETNLASLEDANFCVCASSGMAACALVMHLFKAGECVFCSENIHPEVRKYMEDMAKVAGGIKVEFINMSDLNEVKEKTKSGVNAIWVESPGGSTLEVFDLTKLAEIANENKLMLIVDNTALSPYLQNPLAMGAAIVVHSCTNAICGHNDVLMGAVFTNNKDIHAGVKRNSVLMGCIPSPFDCYLVLRGAKTLGPRVDDSEKNSNELAAFLSTHAKVEECIYPGLSSHKGHELAKKQAKGFGSIIGLKVKGGEEEAKKFCHELTFFAKTVGGGCVQSMAYIPTLTTYKNTSEALRTKLGIAKNLVALSIGIEDVKDLKNDLIQALDKI